MSDIFRDYSFGGWLHEFRINKEITLRGASKLLNMQPSYLCKLEKSELDPPQNGSKIEYICNQLDFDEYQLKMLMSLAYQHHLSKLKTKFEIKGA